MEGHHINRFLESLQVQNYSPQSLKSYRSSLDQFDWFLRIKRIGNWNDVTQETIRDYSLSLIDRGLSVNTQFVRLNGVFRFFRFLRELKFIEFNPCLDLPLPKTKKGLPKRILSKEEANLLLSLPNKRTKMGKRDSAILELFYSTGIRLGEMTSLTMEDVDLKNRLLRVNKGKGNKDRLVPFGRRCFQSLKLYLEKVWIYWSKHQLNHSLWLSIRYPHPPLKFSQIESLVKRNGKKGGLHHITPHVWRHSCASHLTGNGINIQFVRLLLGHQTLRTTQIYLKTSIPELKQYHQRNHPR